MSQIKMKHVNGALQALTKLGKKSLPVQLFVRVARLKKRVTEAAEISDEARLEILADLGVTDKHGNKTLEPGGVNWDAAQARFRELGDVEQEIGGSIKLSELRAEFEKSGKDTEDLANILADLDTLVEWDTDD